MFNTAVTEAIPAVTSTLAGHTQILHITLPLVAAHINEGKLRGLAVADTKRSPLLPDVPTFKELGFDWLLGQFNIGNKKVFGGGGTSGTSPATNPGDFPFVMPNGTPVGQFPVTGGNRSGNLALSANAIDALLFPSMGSSPAR